ncbi:MAG: hypothetical protein ACXVFL_15875 [Solirubrobacteraceae bacterium]
MRILTRALTPPPGAVLLLALAAVAVAIGGFEHARLYHRGYDAVEVVGPLFMLNAIASAVAIALLALGRVALFALGSLAINLGSLVSIVISHSSSFFGFSEGGYDATATAIVVAEVAAVLLTLAALAAGAVRERRAVAA